MALNLEKLSKFDLEEGLENRIFMAENRERLLDFLNTIREVQNTDQFIRELPSFPRSTQDIINKEIRSAVGATLAIEGTILRDEEIEESFRKAEHQRKLEKKDQEAANTKRAYKYIVDVVDNHQGEFIYSEAHIKQIHQYLTDNVEYVSPNVPGQYRDITAGFGEPRKTSFCESKADIEAIMPKFINWLNKTGSGFLTGNDIVKAIMAHYYLTEIHPFGDGNGRTARALEAFILYVNNINIYGFRALAKFWDNNRYEYILLLGNIRSNCDPCDFLIRGIKGYLDELKRIKGSVLKMLKQLMLQDYVRWLFSKKKIKPRIFGVLMFLIHSGRTPFDEFMSSPELTALYAKRNLSTKYKDLKKMREELGLIVIFKEDGKKFIEPNFQKLEELEYTV